MDRTLSLFSSAEVVAAYAAPQGARDCEAFLFKTYIKPGSDLLDLGVGAGRTTAILAPSSGRYLGVDYSETMIVAARQAFPQYRFEVMDAADMRSIESASFDVILFSYNGIGFLPSDASRQACLAECRRILRPGGTFVFSLYNSTSVLVRPTRASRSPAATLKGVLKAIVDSAKRAAGRIFTRSFWLGHGYVRTSAHGGFTVFAASPAYVERELRQAGLTLAATYCEQYPNSVSAFLRRWTYYVAKKPEL